MAPQNKADAVIKNPRRRQGTMKLVVLTKFLVLTIVFVIVLAAVISTAFRVNVSANWEEKRCDPYVVALASFFKPTEDPRTPSQFATDNFSFCQKQYVQDALRIAAEVPKSIAEASAASAGLVQNISSVVADVFFNMWNFCYEAYASFMETMKHVAKLFQNFMINLHGITERLQGAVLSIAYGLIGLIIAYINSVQLSLIVSIIVIGIINAVMIILFLVLWPILSVFMIVTALVQLVVVVVVTAIAAAMVADLFTPGACFGKGTSVQMQNGGLKPVEEIKIGDILSDGGRVTATHLFSSNDVLYTLYGIRVSGDHLVIHPTDSRKQIPVRLHPDALAGTKPFWGSGNRLWCLTTTTRRIPCTGIQGTVLFADWEEIPEDDTEKLEIWYRTVWQTLNGSPASEPAAAAVLDAEAGLSPDCQVACIGWNGATYYKPIRDICVGDRVADGPNTTTSVVGKVMIAGDQATDAVGLSGSPDGLQIVSAALWVRQGDVWRPAAGVPIDIHPIRWEHLYTSSGSFIIRGGWRIRDASDIGLAKLESLVDSIVLDSQ